MNLPPGPLPIPGLASCFSLSLPAEPAPSPSPWAPGLSPEGWQGCVLFPRLSSYPSSCPALEMARFCLRQPCASEPFSGGAPQRGPWPLPSNEWPRLVRGRRSLGAPGPSAFPPALSAFPSRKPLLDSAARSSSRPFFFPGLSLPESLKEWSTASASTSSPPTQALTPAVRLPGHGGGSLHGWQAPRCCRAGGAPETHSPRPLSCSPAAEPCRLLELLCLALDSLVHLHLCGLASWVLRAPLPLCPAPRALSQGVCSQPISASFLSFSCVFFSFCTSP